LFIQVDEKERRVTLEGQATAWIDGQRSTLDKLEQGTPVWVRKGPKGTEVWDLTSEGLRLNLLQRVRRCRVVEASTKGLQLEDLISGLSFFARVPREVGVAVQGRKGQVRAFRSGEWIWASFEDRTDGLEVGESAEHPQSLSMVAKRSAASFPKQGKAFGLFIAALPNAKMIDVLVDDTVVHFAYDSSTKITLDGRPVQVKTLVENLSISMVFTRGSNGRIRALIVEAKSYSKKRT
jgi:hypothetical protein